MDNWFDRIERRMRGPDTRLGVERVGKDPATIEREYSEMVKEDVEDLIHRALEARSSYDSGMPLAEFDAGGVEALACSWKEPPERIVEAYAHAFTDLESIVDPLQKIDESYRLHVLAEARNRYTG